ncbi:MAG: hypothetical protein R2753_03545 [Chitinophagales bacterium]
MLVKKDPFLLFPIAIAVEVLLLFSVGAHVSVRLSGILLLILILCQIVFLTTWGGIVLRFVKSKFFQFFWMPIIIALLFFNIVIALQLGLDMKITADCLMNGGSLSSVR